MNTVNVVSTPNINGNVSSCKTEVTVVENATRPSFFYYTNESYATNNCTGKTDVYESWSLTGYTAIAGLVLIALVGYGIIRVINRFTA